MKIQELYELYSKHYLVDTDTRNIRKNTIYFALKGANFNGNKFAEEALSKGALFSVVDEKEFVTNNKIILVNNVLNTLQELANYHRRKLNTPIVSLTGSNGKTTTKELINAVLSRQYKTTATKGNLNNHIGVPLTLLSFTPETEIGIVEMGANHHKEIELLCSITEPDFGYITNFGKAHIEGFGSVEGVIEAKSELYEYLRKNDKIAFLNPNDKIQLKKAAGINSILFDTSKINFIDSNPFVRLMFNQTEICTNLVGKYNFNNICSAITIGKHFNISQENIKKALENYIPTNNRSQIIKLKSNTVLLDAYNANPSSMKAALENFHLINSDSKVVILGDMFELGIEANKEHQNIVDFCSKLNFEQVFFVGNLFFETKTNKPKFNSREALTGYLNNNPISNSHILIKGSRGMALEKILDFIN
jgi:UDP-N-acetylmuramoyl-tripeptide--D-alanyl-D-alanine ligase